MSNDFYVYAWLRPCGEPFYIGKGIGRRGGIIKRNRLFLNIKEKIERCGGVVSVVKLHENLTEKAALALECIEIAKYGRRDIGTGILANMTAGGEGVSGMSSEVREKIAFAKRGKKRSPEAVEKTAKFLRGRKLSEDHRAKIGDSRRGKPRDPLAVKKTAEGNLGKKRTDEARAQMSAAKLGVKQSESQVLLMLESQRLSGPSKNSKSGLKGVSFEKQTQKWVAKITIDGAPKNLGRFLSPSDAAYAYDRAARSAWGDACYTNFSISDLGT